ncbi:MAG: hypothetical protein U5J96_17290 [Ignavibacteriaceae bacterium]|nr:hypothetical protein [Ignavibacteriaceae bacterium]
MPYVGGGIEDLVIVYVAANIPGFLLLIIFLSKKYKYSFSFSFKHGYWLVKESIPLFGTAILTTSYSAVGCSVANLDSVNIQKDFILSASKKGSLFPYSTKALNKPQFSH